MNGHSHLWARQYPRQEAGAQRLIWPGCAQWAVAEEMVSSWLWAMLLGLWVEGALKWICRRLSCPLRYNPEAGVVEVFSDVRALRVPWIKLSTKRGGTSISTIG